MSNWVNRINDHGIWKLLEDVAPLIETALARDNIDAAAIDSLERIRTILNIANSRLASVEPFLLDPRVLTNLENSFNAIKNALSQFNSDGNIDPINSVNQNADDALIVLQRIHLIENSKDLTALISAIAHYRGEIDKHLRQALTAHNEVAEAAKENAQNLAALSAAITAEKERLTGVISEFQTQFSAGQDARQTEFTAAQTERQNAFTAGQTERQEKFSSSIIDYQQQFSTAQETRAKEFSDAEAERKEKSNQLLNDYTEKLTEHNTNFSNDREELKKNGAAAINSVRESSEKQAALVLIDLNKIKSDVERVAGVVGNLSLTSGHLRTANTSRNLQFFWQCITVLSLIALVGIGITIAFPTITPHLLNSLFSVPLPSAQISPDTLTDTIYWRGFAARVFLAIALGLLAAYASRQGDKFMELERKNRKIALEMEAVGPFIAPLPKDLQDQFRMDLGSRSFGIPEGESIRKEDPSPVNIVDVLKSKEVQEAIAKALKPQQ